MKKIKILRLLGGQRKGIGQDGFDGRVLCGPESKTFEMCSKYHNDRFETIIVYSKGGRLSREFQEIGINVVPFDTKSKFNVLEIFHILRLIKRYDIDIIQTHGLRVDFFSFAAAKLARIPHIITRHVAVSQHLMKKYKMQLYMLFDNIALRAAARIITVTKVAKEDLVRIQHIDPVKIVTIYNGVDLQKYNTVSAEEQDELRKELKLDGTNCIIGMIAQLSPWKGISYFLQAISIILKETVNVRFLIVGDGPERVALERMAKELDVAGKIIFVGFRRDIPGILSIVDISVLSSLREGMPNALLEAMAMRKPVVATDVGGVAEIVINNKTGYLVKPKDSVGLAKAIIDLVKDKKKCRHFGEAGRKMIEESFSLAKMIDSYEKIYMDVINQ